MIRYPPSMYDSGKEAQEGSGDDGDDDEYAVQDMIDQLGSEFGAEARGMTRRRRQSQRAWL